MTGQTLNHIRRIRNLNAYLFMQKIMLLFVFIEYLKALAIYSKVANDSTSITENKAAPDGKKDTISNPNGTVSKYTYTSANRIETITHSAGNSSISSYAYTYDTNGNRLSQIETQGGVKGKGVRSI